VAHRWSLREIGERYIERVLADVGGDRARAARILDVHPRTLERREHRRGKEAASENDTGDTASS
jgi:ActR/RegA family two-component response regulator